MKKGKILSKREHILLRPDMYIGSVRTREEEKLIYDADQNKIISKNIKYNEGLERIVVELISNAIDNKWESEEMNVKMTKIIITIADDGKFTISNDGRWIENIKTVYEVEDDRDPSKTKSLELYPAESYFGHILAGTNYDDKQEKRKTSGKNGVGAKATNIYSKEFTVTCVDPENKKKFIQTFSNNMSSKSTPKVTSCAQKTGFTEISFLPDFERFGFDGWTDDFKALIHKYAIDCAMITGLNVSFNGEKINVKNLQTYSRLYLPLGTNSMYFNTDDCEVILAEQDEESARTKGFQHVSFVNGIHTKNGGVHVDVWVKGLLEPIRDAFNNSKKSKGKIKQIKLTLEQLKKYFYIFVKTEVDKPEFDSQSKHKLTHPKPKARKAEPSEIKKMMGSWNFMVFINQEIDALEDKKISKTDGKKRLSFGKNVSEANWAGGRRRKECTLLLAEGLSAKSFAIAGIGSIPEGHDRYGVLALKGKLINHSNNNELKVSQNAEIQMLKDLLGLKRKTDYSKDDEFSQLRYGKVGILTDADSDGSHIAGLVLNYFYREHPTLIDRGYIELWNTPAVRVSFSADNIMPFYSHSDFKKWQAKQKEEQLKKAKIKYYKGLGTHKLDDAKDTFIDQKTLQFFKDGDEEYNMNLGFDGKYSDERKKWLTEFDPNEEVFEFDEQGNMVQKDLEFVEGPISLGDFVNHRLILYHEDNLKRMIPDVLDGFKESQRKIIYTCFETHLKSSIKVAQLAGRVSEKSGYHHGEASLQEAITNMGQGYVGSNNIPLLVNDGMFGTRDVGGKDHASARYIYTYPDNIVRSIYPKDDDELLEPVIDEGQAFEPQNYMPVLPMILVNGATGIGSGFSTDIPCYNPEKLVEWIRVWIGQQENKAEYLDFEDDDGKKYEVDMGDYPLLKPWYRGFTGEVDVTEDKLGIQKVTTKGKIQKDAKGKYHITEIPIQTWTADFQEYLEDHLMKDKHVTKIDKYHTPNTVHFVLTPAKDFQPDITFKHNLQKMVKSERMSNMVALHHGRPRVFRRVEEIMELFCKERYSLYSERKKNLLKKWKRELMKDRNRFKFIKEVISKTLKIYNRDEEELFAEMEEKGYEKDENSKEGYGYLVNMSMRSMTKQKLQELKRSVENWKKKISDLENKSEGELWKDDLENFEKSYQTFLRTRKDDKSKSRKK